MSAEAVESSRLPLEQVLHDMFVACLARARYFPGFPLLACRLLTVGCPQAGKTAPLAAGRWRPI